MRIPRIYHAEFLEIDQVIPLRDNAARHVGKVLRLSLKDKILLFNGDGNEYLAEIIESQKKRLAVKVMSKNRVERESSLPLVLLQAVCRQEKMDWIIQKAVELGIQAITPILTHYSVAKVTEQKLAHWQGIIISACEQCGRNRIPLLSPPMALTHWLSQHPVSCGLIFSPTAEISLPAIKIPGKTSVYLLIGPEGGFSAEEIRGVEQYHFQAIRLGNRILRTETAAISAISALQTLFGDFH